MLWSLIKVVLFLAVVAIIALGVQHLLGPGADMGFGTIRIAVANTEFTLGPLQAIIALLLLLLAVWIVLQVLGLLVALLRFVNGDETAINRHFARSRQRKGLNALSDALLALAAGEGAEAQSKARRADKYLQRPDLTNLLLAQSAEMTGDRGKADEVYRQLVQDDRTKFVGVRGLLKHKLDEGDTDTALALAQKAFELRPRHSETQDVLLKLQAGRHDWTGARKTLGAKLKSGSMPRDVHRRRDAVLALGQAKDIVDENQTAQAREVAIEANRMSPDLVPAAVMAARGYIARGQDRYATRTLKKAWNAQPHPDLAAAFAEIVPDETPDQRVRRFTTLTRIHPEHPETRMLLAELQIANEDFPAARRALGDLATSRPTARSVTIMAAIERGEGADDAVVRGWLTRALSVSRGPQWVCGNCHTVHGEWGPICGNCGAFDTMSWSEPKDSVVSMPSRTDMLPLIIGRTEEERSEVEIAPAHDATRPEEPQGTKTSEDETPAVATAPLTPEASGTPRPAPSERTATTVPEAEVIVPEEQREEAARNREKT